MEKLKSKIIRKGKQIKESEKKIKKWNWCAKSLEKYENVLV